MAEEKENRRVKLTKIILKNSLVELMRENSISKISVKMICETADVNRSTFYSHYVDQFALLKDIELNAFTELKKYINKLEKHLQDRNDPKTTQGIKDILIYIQNNADIFRVLLSDNGDIKFQKDLMLWIHQQTIEDFWHAKNPCTIMKDYGPGFMATGALNILQTWLKNGMKESPEEMSEFITKILYNGLSSFI
ncbi:MAG: TetR-like C-terminal domain-containing protein [Mobilitalea sp.]